MMSPRRPVSFLSMDRDASPPRRRTRRSGSPPNRDFEYQGGGRSSSRNRSPGRYVKGGGDRDSRPRPPRDDRPRDNGYGARGPRDDAANGRGADGGYGDRGRPRDSGYGERDRPRDSGPGEQSSSMRRRDGEYTEQDRERERAGERRKYELEATGEVSGSPSPISLS